MKRKTISSPLPFPAARKSPGDASWISVFMVRTLGFHLFYCFTTVAVRLARVFDLFLFFNAVIKRIM